MILFYVDEGGTCSKDNQTNFFILASIAIHEQDSLETYKKFYSLKSGILSKKKPEDWEFKSREIYQGLGRFKGWKLETRVRIFSEISQTLTELPCNLLAVLVNKELFYKDKEELKDDVGLYRLTFNRLLKELNNFMGITNESGILLMDSRSTHSTSLQDSRLVKAYRDWTLQEDNYRFVEQPWFGVSQFCIGLQFADYIAYLLNLKFQPLELGSPKAEFLKVFDILHPKIHLFEIPENK